MIDLHTHSTASDGTLTPEDLIAEAEAVGLHAVALTDHDTTAGIDAFCRAAEGRSIRAIPGVEISAHLDGGCLHILGLLLDPHHPHLLDLLKQTRYFRRQRNRVILARLADLGMPITEDQLEAYANSRVVCRSHLAHLLVERGFAEYPQQAFDRWLGRGRAAWSALELPSVARAIVTIKEAGGVAVWAHPTGLNRRSPGKIQRVARFMKQHGLDALETSSPYYTAQQQAQAEQVAAQCGLLRCGGSDYHGTRTPDVKLGVGRGNLAIPDEILEQLAARRK